MDRWKYFDITHRFHTLMNPQSEEKVDELINLLQIKPNSRVVDIGCGKGEFLIRLAEKAKISGVGVDLSPYTIKEARERTEKRGTDAEIEYVESDGKAYLEENDDEFDLSICMGASWIFGGYEGTLKALTKNTKPGGIIISGEPYWKKQPSQWYLDITEMSYSTFGTNAQNMELAEHLGLKIIYALHSNLDDWDKYEGLTWRGVDDHMQRNPGDPDNEEILKWVKKDRTAYIREGRDVLGWAIYVFRKSS